MQHWFKPKRYGFGAEPSAWQGWVLTALYVVIMTALSIWMIGDVTSIDRVTSFLVITAAVTIIFVGVAWRTTEGGWRWRWGDKD